MLLKAPARPSPCSRTTAWAPASPGYTTAKVSSLHGLIYRGLASELGRRRRAASTARPTRPAWSASRTGCRSAAIDCDFRRKQAFTYAEQGDDVDEVAREVEAARDAGLPAS